MKSLKNKIFPRRAHNCTRRGSAAGILTWDMSGTFPRLEESVELAAGSWRQQQLGLATSSETQQLPQQIFYKFRRRYSIEHNQHWQRQSPGCGRNSWEKVNGHFYCLFERLACFSFCFGMVHYVRCVRFITIQTLLYTKVMVSKYILKYLH